MCQTFKRVLEQSVHVYPHDSPTHKRARRRRIIIKKYNNGYVRNRDYSTLRASRSQPRQASFCEQKRTNTFKYTQGAFLEKFRAPSKHQKETSMRRYDFNLVDAK